MRSRLRSRFGTNPDGGIPETTGTTTGNAEVANDVLDSDGREDPITPDIAVLGIQRTSGDDVFPEWMAKAKRYLDAVSEDARWTEAVEAWTTFERLAEADVGLLVLVGEPDDSQIIWGFS